MKTIVISVSPYLFRFLDDAVDAFGRPDRIVLLTVPNNCEVLRERQLPLRAELMTVNPDGTLDGEVELNKWDMCVLNGGSSSQKWAMARLSRLGTVCKVVNLKKGGYQELAALT